MKKRSLITGVAGFIGSNLARTLLAEGEEVYGIDDFSTGSKDNIADLSRNHSFFFAEGSVVKPEPLKRLIGTVQDTYHLAAAVGVRYILEHPFESLEVNVEGTRNVLHQAMNFRKRVMVVSSSEVYGKNPNMPLAEEDDRLLGPTQSARWSYSSAKALDEFMALAAHRTKNLDVCIVRLFNVVGPGQTGRYGMVLPNFVGQAIKNQPITVFGDGKQTRTFCHVADVIDAMRQIMASDKTSGEVINVGGTEEISMLDLAERVKTLLDSTSDIRLIPYKEAYGEGFDDMPRRVPSLDKIYHLTGWTPRRTLDDAIRDVAEYLRSRKEQK